MEKRKRRRFTQESKEEAVKLITEQGYTIAEASRIMEIHPNLLGKWKKEFLNPESEEERNDKEEIKRLKKEIKMLKLEKEILKNAAAFFAKETL